MALLINGHRVEYPREVVDAMPPGLRLALARSPARITGGRRRGRRGDTGTDALRIMTGSEP
jgi:hypothetical protein